VNFTDQRERLRRIVHNALDGTKYESSRPEEDGRLLVVEAKRPDGTIVAVRFRGVRSSDADALPAAGTSLRLQSVSTGGGFWLLGLLIPAFRGLPRGTARVRIEAGSTRLEVVCEDAEWWEETSNP
jgi:hypothetical protein